MSFVQNRISAALLVVLLAGCSHELAPPGSRFLVSAHSAQFYKYGPAQSFGADFVLPKGQRLIMLDRSFGFSRVMTDDGITGWVAEHKSVVALSSKAGMDKRFKKFPGLVEDS